MCVVWQAFFGGGAEGSTQAVYYLEQMDAYSKNQGFLTLDEVYGYFDYIGGPEAQASIDVRRTHSTRHTMKQLVIHTHVRRR